MNDFFDNLTYTNDDIIHFPAGVPGFERNKDFVLVHNEEFAPFEWLACVDGSHLRFAVINPMLIKPDYAPNLIKEQLEDLAFSAPEDVLVYSIVTIRENPVESTVNLIGPIIINKKSRRAKQIIIDDERYGTQEPIIGKT